MRPGGVMSAGMMPALLAPGDARPGQLGPTMRVLSPEATLCAQNAVESCTGIPSVMTTASSMPASIASTTAALANFGGTKTTVVSAPVALMASPTELKTGTFTPSKSTSWPPLPGVTPPTMLVPALSMRRVCFEPSEPVMPCTMTFEFLVNQIAMSCPHGCELGGALSRAVHGVHPLHQRVVGGVQDVPTRLGVVSVQPDDERLGHRLAAFGQQAERVDDASGDFVARGDATEDVDEDALNGRVRQNDLEAVRHDRGARATADGEEVRRAYADELLTRVRHHIERRH